MTPQTYWLCVAMSILGQALTLFLVTIPSFKKTARALNKQFSWKEWIQSDWNIILGTQVLTALCIFGLDEIVTWKPVVLEYVKWFFAGIGAFGSTVAMAKLSQFEKQLTALTDVKASVSDAMTGGTTTVKETIEKGTEATGIPIEETLKTKP